MKFTMHIEIPVVVEFDYSPPQEASMTDPAFPADVTITSVSINDVELIGALDSDTVRHVENECFAYAFLMRSD